MRITTKYRKLLARYAPQPIRSAAEYRCASEQLEKLMVPHPDVDRGRLIEVLATLIEKYESRECPNPQVSPAEMLAHLLEAAGIQCATLSRETGIPATTLSNVLARRRDVSKKNAIRLGEYFGLSPIVFLMASGGDMPVGEARTRVRMPSTTRRAPKAQA